MGTNRDFRLRWKFMLTRWRPDVYYWGCVIMTRNLLVAFAGVISSDPSLQLTYVVAVVNITLSATALHRGLRAHLLGSARGDSAEQALQCDARRGGEGGENGRLRGGLDCARGDLRGALHQPPGVVVEADVAE